ncbi:molybdopterin biosynthesis protein [Paludifilum halophilum]|uniref:Molybdopterin molybdenumtransferase n=1 Tax=Paludifilum halophilum TaxID=1642702 RepID=A0A235B384_9BACL|nr:molybdopterin biosynthesis protein [Paludifilum halophilum]OYD06744.1 molybdopterin biosynthesis protein [Paludifilum halophilum]
MRKTVLDNIPIVEALYRLQRRISFHPETEWVPVADAGGRVTAEPVRAVSSMPAYPASAMDGIAVRAAETAAASQGPLRLREGKDFIFINTGDPLPADKDAVIMIERVRELGEGIVEIDEPAIAWKHVRQAGEDVTRGEVILPSRHLLRPVDLGALLAGGVTEAAVLSKPRVAVIPTGSEIVPPGKEVGRGQIIEFNGTVFAGFLKEWGAIPDYRGIVPDEIDAIRRAVSAAVQECDIVVLNAGSSAGTRDYTWRVLEELGEVVVHGVAARPGKPVVLALIDGKPVLGLPGYPVSAYLSLEWFARPLIQSWYGLEPEEKRTATARLTRPVTVKPGATDHIRLRLGRVDKELHAFPLSRGAGATLSMVRADALLRVPAESRGFQTGEEVQVELYRSPEAIDRSLLFSGSDDPVLPCLESMLRERDPSFSLSMEWTGSLGGVEALKKGECHMAGIHARGGRGCYFQKEMKDISYVRIHLAKRRLGWITAPGNPLNIQGAEDLARTRIDLVNRPRRSGTRMLLEELLEGKGIEPAMVSGFSREALTHLRAASAVACGTADVALGLEAAASTFGLEFLPVREENYEILLRRSFYESDAGEKWMDVLRSRGFRQALESYPGYDGTRCGEVL